MATGYPDGGRCDHRWLWRRLLCSSDRTSLGALFCDPGWCRIDDLFLLTRLVHFQRPFLGKGESKGTPLEPRQGRSPALPFPNSSLDLALGKGRKNKRSVL